MISESSINLFIPCSLCVNSMKALVYHGPNDVQLDDKPHSAIQMLVYKYLVLRSISLDIFVQALA